MGWLKSKMKEREKMKELQKKAEKRAEKKLKKKSFQNKKGWADSFDAGVSTFGSCVDFTLLDPRTTSKDVIELCNIGAKNGYYSVIVPPIFVEFAKNYVESKLSGCLKVGSVVGFPLGNTTSRGKIQEVKNLIRAGADEIEVSLDVSMVRMGEYAAVKAEISRIARMTRRQVLKIILETAYLTSEEIERVLRICAKCKVDYVMTSSGYAPIGATLEGVEKIVSLASGKIGVKASGGVKTRMEAESFLRLGCSRIGTSRIL